MVECAAKGMRTPCTGEGPPTRRCGLCGAVAYCSQSHQLLHWNYHREECGRFQQQMTRTDVLNDFPFTFSLEIANLSESRCSFLISRNLHNIGIWKSECCCAQSITFSSKPGINEGWNLPSPLCPCTDPATPPLSSLRSWKDYYQWRCLPFHSPVALLLHWPLTVYYCFQLSSINSLTIKDKLIIHYLGPDKELQQLAVFRELGALFAGVEIHIEFFGPAVPRFRDGTSIKLSSYPHCCEDGCTCKTSTENANLEVSNHKSSSVDLHFFSGFYHDRYKDREKATSPSIVIAPNAGIAAYSSWLPTIELIKEMGVPAFFSDYCEEAANLASQCIATATGQPLSVPVQINPFRQPIQVEESALYLPCYSNCFLFGM